MTPRLDAIGIAVRDLAASREFYRRVGLEIPEGDDHVEVAVGGLRVMFDTEEVVRSFDPDWQPPDRGHRVSLAFACDSPGAVDTAYRELVDAGYRGTKEPWDAFWGQRYAEVLDPDGNPVHLFAALG
jgi:catechol 2,3-dioxygenase-like lactoylglutathione lyase family enzyme